MLGLKMEVQELEEALAEVDLVRSDNSKPDIQYTIFKVAMWYND